MLQLIENYSDLMVYFSDHKPSKFLEKEFMFRVLEHWCSTKLKKLVTQSLKIREPKSLYEKDYLVKLTLELNINPRLPLNEM